MATKVSLINMKGGVGKSTLTINLAWHFAAFEQWRKKVLVIDLDPQFNASQYLLGGAPQYKKLLKDGRPTIWDIFEQNTRIPGGIKTLDPHDPIHNITNIYGGGKIDLIPSRLELAFSLKNPGQQKERQLSKIVAKIEDEYDLILIDCAPTESILTTAAYLASDYLLVPVKPEYLSSIGLPLLVNSMRDFKDDYEDHKLHLAGVVFNATTDYSPEEKKSKAEVRQVARQNMWYVFKAEVPYSRSYPKGAREGQPIFRTSYCRGYQIESFDNFAKEFSHRVKM